MRTTGTVDSAGTMDSVKKSSGYTYWVRENTNDAAPAPVARKLSENDIAQNATIPAPLGSVWNQGGTWEEKSLNSWASHRIKELLQSADKIWFPHGNASLTQVSSCTGDGIPLSSRLCSNEADGCNVRVGHVIVRTSDSSSYQATLVTVRKKKRVGYNFDISIKFNGELLSCGEKIVLQGTLKVIEATYGELDDLQVEVVLEKSLCPRVSEVGLGMPSANPSYQY